MREVKLTYKNGLTYVKKMSDKEIADMVKLKKIGCLVVDFEILC